MDSYYFNLKNGKKLLYQPYGTFTCPVVDADEKKEYMAGCGHSLYLKTGSWLRQETKSKREILPNGDEKITTVVELKKIRKGRQDLKCKCGATLIFKGFHAWIEKTIKKGKDCGIFTIGEKTKMYEYRYFKSLPARKKWIESILKKDRNN